MPRKPCWAMGRSTNLASEHVIGQLELLRWQLSTFGHERILQAKFKLQPCPECSTPTTSNSRAIGWDTCSQYLQCRFLRVSNFQFPLLFRVPGFSHSRSLGVDPSLSTSNLLILVRSSMSIHRWLSLKPGRHQTASRHSWLTQNSPAFQARRRGVVAQSPYLSLLQQLVMGITSDHSMPPLTWQASNDRMHIALHRRHPFWGLSFS